MKKHTKIIVLVAMVVLLGVTGYLNLTLNNRIVDAQAGQAKNYFSEHAETREQKMQTDFLYYDAILNSEASSQQDKIDAQEKKFQLTENMRSEIIMEDLIKGTGFDDVIVSYSNSYINVIIKAQLDRAQVAQIVSIVKQQTGASSDYITITPV